MVALGEVNSDIGRYFDPSTGGCEIKRLTKQGILFNCDNPRGCIKCPTAIEWNLTQSDNPIDLGFYPPMGDID